MTIGTIKYVSRDGKVTCERDWEKLPESSQHALATAGLAHEVGNVVASAVVSAIRSHLAGDGKAADVTKEQVAKFRKDHPEMVAKWAREEFEDALSDIDNGTMGEGSRGPRIDPVEREYRMLVEQAAIGALAAHKLLLPDAPKKGQPAPVVRLGDGTELTRERCFEMIRSSKKPQYVGLRKQAEQTVAARARLAQAKEANGEATVANLF